MSRWYLWGTRLAANHLAQIYSCMWTGETTWERFLRWLAPQTRWISCWSGCICLVHRRLTCVCFLGAFQIWDYSLVGYIYASKRSEEYISFGDPLPESWNPHQGDIEIYEWTCNALQVLLGLTILLSQCPDISVFGEAGMVHPACNMVPAKYQHAFWNLFIPFKRQMLVSNCFRINAHSEMLL